MKHMKKALRQKHFGETERKPLWLGFRDHRVEAYKREEKKMRSERKVRARPSLQGRPEKVCRYLFKGQYAKFREKEGD